jgi:hypothetical protein
MTWDVRLKLTLDIAYASTYIMLCLLPLARLNRRGKGEGKVEGKGEGKVEGKGEGKGEKERRGGKRRAKRRDKKSKRKKRQMLPYLLVLSRLIPLFLSILPFLSRLKYGVNGHFVFISSLFLLSLSSHFCEI